MTSRDCVAPNGERDAALSRRHLLQAGFGVAATASLSGFLAACGEDEGDNGGGDPGDDVNKSIAFSFGYTDVPIYGSLKTAAEELAEERGYELLTDSARAKLDAQVAALDSYIQRKVGAMVVLPLEPNAAEGIARRAQDAGVLWITYSLDLKNQDGSILFPPEDSGRILGEHAAQWINKNAADNAEVLFLNNSGQAIGDLRLDPVKKIFRERTKANIVAEQDANTPDVGLRVAEDVLKANPNLSVVIGMNDDGALGAAQAFKNTGKDPATVYIGGQDGAERALEAILEPDSYYKASSALDLSAVGRAVAQFPIDIIEGEAEKGKSVELLPKLATAEDPELVKQLLKSFE